MKIKILLQALMFLSIVTFLAGTGFAQQAASKRSDTGGFQAGSKMTLVGQIDYKKNMGGYYVKSENPPAVLFIDNQNVKQLEKLSKSKKQLSIQGHATAGADYLFIEKIDGKPYQGD